MIFRTPAVFKFSKRRHERVSVYVFMDAPSILPVRLHLSIALDGSNMPVIVILIWFWYGP
ncbi:hypothetical protein BDW68DRAFT_169481 [Aspergillus falconensis]